MSNESGKTCMNPVARIIPAAKDFTITNKLLSGLRAGTERVTRGKQTPIMLVTRMETMAMIFRGNAFDLLLHESSESASHSSETAERTCVVEKERRMKKMEMSLESLVAIDSRIDYCGRINFAWLYSAFLGAAAYI